MDKLQVHEIFYSVEGEGARVGTPTLFVRLSGCSLGCEYCDTKEASDPFSGISYNIEDLVKEVEKFKTSTNVNRLSITGGNPMETDLTLLYDFISQIFIPINIEHPGIFLNFPEESKFLNKLTRKDSITFDIKTPCSKVLVSDTEDFKKILVKLNKGPTILIKAVVESKKDIEFLDSFLGEISQFTYSFTVQPCEINKQFAKVDYKELFMFLTKHNGRLVPQIHKCLGLE